MLILAVAACQPADEDTTNYTYNIDCVYCDDGNTQSQQGIVSVTIILLADQSVGRDGMLTIYQKTESEDHLISDIPILITNGGQFSFDLEPGHYWVAATGTAFTSYAEFTAATGQNNVIVLEMYEWPIITFYANLSAQSPSGAQPIGYGVEIMRFSLLHDWPEDLHPDHVTFQINYTLNLSLNACYLTWLNPASGFYENLGASPASDHLVTFWVDPNLPESTIPTGGMTTYKLACDVLGTPNNDALQASLVDFQAQPTTTAQRVWTLPLQGNLLNF